MQIGLFITHANSLLGADLSGLLDIAATIDRAGIDYITVADHVLLGADLDGHGALGGGALAYPPDEPYPDPLITLAAIAAVTTRVRLATGVLIAPLRSAPVLAKSAATLAVISRGRLDLGVGTGWQQAEYDAVDVPMSGKAARMDDTMAACQSLWRSASASYQSPTVSFADLCCSPRPPGGDIPLWFAGQPIGPTLRRVVSMGAGWLPLRPLEPDDARRVRLDLATACGAAERDPRSVQVRMPMPVLRDRRDEVDFETMAERIGELAEAGVDGVHLTLRDVVRRTEELTDTLIRLGALSS